MAKKGNVPAPSAWTGAEGLRSMLRPIGDLRADPRNARKHPKRSIDAIAASLQRFGQRKPIVAQSDGIVVAGNGTLEAARKLGWPALAVADVEGLSDEDVRAFALADNRASELSEWNLDELIWQIKDVGEDLIAEIGFTSDDVLNLLDSQSNPSLVIVRAAPEDLKPHPKNYKQHPDDQIDHIVKSIEQHGFFRNVVVARGNVILAGHGVVAAARRMGLKRIPVVCLDLDPNDVRALKVMASDNEISHLAMVDDRALTGMLKDILKIAGDLDGTGFNRDRLALLAMATRPPSEVGDVDEALLWLGMPEYEGPKCERFIIKVNCDSEQDREDLLAKMGATGFGLKSGSSGTTFSLRWPLKKRETPSGVAFETGDEKPSPEADVVTVEPAS